MSLQSMSIGGAVSGAKLECRFAIMREDPHLIRGIAAADETYVGFGLFDVLLLEEELPVQVGEINRIQIDLEDEDSCQCHGAFSESMLQFALTILL